MILKKKSEFDLGRAKCNGFLIFDPKRPGIKKTKRDVNTWVIAKVDNSITDYYCWWLERVYGIKLSRPAWGTHVTIVNDKDRVTDLDRFNEVKEKFNSKFCQIQFDVNIKKVWQFWSLDVYSNGMFKEIRRSLGLNPDFPFHITIGRDD
jgi:hypothetical protein